METKEQSKLGHRAQRTRELLQQAIMELIAEKGYGTISVQDITERARVGRTTFYLHYKSKDDLLMNAHVDSMAHLGWAITLDSLLAAEPPRYLVNFIESVAQSRAAYLDVGRSEDALIFARRIRQHVAEAIEQCLQAHFEEKLSKIPFTILANYLAGAQVSLISWWLESHKAFTAQQIAVSYQTLQRAALQDALRLIDPDISACIQKPPNGTSEMLFKES